MKKLIFIFFLIISVNLPAQPGDIVGHSLRRFDELTKQLKQDPDNYDLIWERLNLPLPLYPKHFDIHTQSGTMSRESIIFPREYSFFIQGSNVDNHKKMTSCTVTANDIISDLSKLIDNKVEIEIKHKLFIPKADSIDFILMRGRLYYFLGEIEQAINDYLLALGATTDDDLKWEIYGYLAACYYHSTIDEHGQINNSNKRQALKYIDLISPVEFTEYYRLDPCENIKIELLKSLKEDNRLENYYKKLIWNGYGQFKGDAIEKRKYEHGSWYSAEQNYVYTLGLINDLAIYYYERKNYDKAKWLGEQTIKFFPKNANGHIYLSYGPSKHYDLLNKIYQTETFKDYDKGIDCLIESLHDPYGSRKNMPKDIEKYIEESLQKYPEEPRLYLALAIWHYNNNKYQAAAELQSNIDKIFSLLEKAQQLGFVDYRVPYIKALMHLHVKKNYQLGLIEINKALQHYQGNPNLYRTKCDLLSKLPNPDEKEIQKLKQEIKMKSRTNNYQDMSYFMEEIQK